MITKANTRAVQLLNRGLQVSRPSNRLDQARYLRLVNVRSYLDGSIETRPGQAAVSTTPTADTPIHSLSRLNVDITGASQARTLVAGCGTKLYTTTADFLTPTLRDSGYSGNRLSMVPHRPTQSPEPWMYVMDSLRSRKVRVNGDNYPMGVAPPNVAPTVALGPPLYTTISDFEAVGAWTVGGTAGAIAAATRLTGATTVTRILFDTATTGNASIQPSTLDDNIQAGMFLTFGGGIAETIRVLKVLPAITSTTIAAITYDTGTSGLCTIQLTAPAANLDRDVLIRLASGGATDEAVRVISATVGPDGLASIRCSTVNTHIIGHTVDGLGSFRAYCVSTHAAAETLATNKFRSTVTAGTGYINLVGALALLTSNSRPIQPDDEIHISLRFDNPANLLEAKLMFDIDANTNDFTRNYLYYSIQPNLLTRALQNTTTTATEIQRILQQQQMNQQYGGSYNSPLLPPWLLPIENGPDLPPYEPPFDLTPPDQTTPGNNQWSEVVIKVSDLLAVGADAQSGARNLKNVAAIRVQFQTTANVVCDIDAWWIGGTYGPDSGIGQPYLYCYTGRNKATGATSNPSPPIRTGIEAHRQRITGTLTQHADTQVDALDIYRYGGALNEWHYVLTTTNVATPTFTDDFADDVIAANPLLEFDNYQPFPSTDTPKSGTVNVAGTKVTWASGDVFNTSWGRNSTIRINGIAYTLYASPTSTTVLETNENVGNLTGATFEIPDAILLGQLLPVMWGPYGGGIGGVFMFGCGDPLLPGTLFITKGNNPDACNFRLEITSGSEQLINGCIYDGRPYVFSSERMYSIEPINGGQDWVAREVANSIGLFARWGLTVADRIYFVGKDGIYVSEGGQPQAISDDSFYNLFLHEASDPSVTDAYGIAAFPFTDPDSICLDRHKSTLYLNYKASSVYYTLVYDIKTKTWSQDTYGHTVATHCSDDGKYAIEDGLGVLMGGSDGTIYKFDSGTKVDVAAEIACRVTTGYDDCGEPRSDKVFAEAFFDADIGIPLTTAMTVRLLLNDASTVIETLTPAVTTGRSAQYLNINSGNGRLARNAALDIAWTGALVRIFEYHYAYYPKTDRTSLRSTDWMDLGRLGSKWLQGVTVRADTLNVAKSFSVETDNGDTLGPFSLTHNGEMVTAFSFPSPPIAELVRITTADADPWVLLDAEFTWEMEPALVEDWISQPSSLDLPGYKQVKEVWLPYRSNADFNLTINVDGTNISLGTVASSSGVQKTVRIMCPSSLKGKLFQCKSSGGSARIYLADISMLSKAWGSDGPYQSIKMIGDISRSSGGARI